MGFAMVALLTTGCLYPNELRKENQVPPGEYISLVQHAVDEFQAKTGVLPIKNSELDTPIYEKYVIDFRRLQERNFLSLIPANAYEKGGRFYYVLVNPENHPQVKLMDLVAFRKAADTEKTVRDYIGRHGGLPAAGQAYDGLFWIDYTELGIKRAQVESVFTRAFLNLMMDDAGHVYIDYAPDIVALRQKAGGNAAGSDADLRAILVQNSYFVPVRSLPYRLVNGDPYAVK